MIVLCTCTYSVLLYSTCTMYTVRTAEWLDFFSRKNSDIVIVFEQVTQKIPNICAISQRYNRTFEKCKSSKIRYVLLVRLFLTKKT